MNKLDYILASESYFNSKIQSWEGKSCSAVTIEGLPGDASDRLYFRIHYSIPFNHNKTVVLMQLPFPELDQELPFINIMHHLKVKGIPVPTLYCYDSMKGCLFLEDFSDTTLAQWLKGKSYSEKKAMYTKAIDILLAMQSPDDLEHKTECIAFKRAFNADKFLWELDFFTENMLFRLLNLDIALKEILLMREHFVYICETLERQPMYFTHRDYHSRNLMVLQGDELGVLDFQDARLGLCQYDLASLLMDSYFVLGEVLREELLDYYLGCIEKLEARPLNEKEFRRIFYLTAIQRNLKAVGTFAYKMVEHRNNQYLKFIPQTLQYLWGNLKRFPELKPLQETLRFYLDIVPGVKEVDKTTISY